MKNRKAIILAAGFGIRLESITMHKPKCMIKVGGKPILEYQLDAFSNLQLDEIIIVTGYKSEVIKDYVNQQHYDNIKIVENTNYQNSNNMFSLWQCKNELLQSDHVYISNADVLFDESILQRLALESGSHIICQKDLFNIESMKISLNGDSTIGDISKDIDQKDSFGCSIDVYSFSNQICNELVKQMSIIIEKNGDLNQWTEVAIQNLVKLNNKEINPFCLIENEKWFEIDTMDDLIEAEIVFAELSEELKNKKGFIFDLDGTIYIGENSIPGAKEFISKVQSKNLTVKFISNNSSKNKTEYSEKLQSQGIIVDNEQIILSTDIAIQVLNKQKVYC